MMLTFVVMLWLAAVGPQPLPPRHERQEIPAPVLVSLRTEFKNKHAELTWTHKTASWFVVRTITETSTNFLSLQYNDKRNEFSWKMPFEPGKTTFDVAATDGGRSRSKWSNSISVQPSAEQ